MHIELTAETYPNPVGLYRENSKWHFLISSDGEKLISDFTWCGTMQTCFYNQFLLYQIICENVLGEMAAKKIPNCKKDDIIISICNFIADGHPIPDEWDENEWDEDDWEEWAEWEGLEAAEYLPFVKAFAKAYQKELLPILTRVIEAPEQKVSPELSPQSFDNRFQGKRFVVKGRFNGPSTEQIEEIIHGFGGQPEKSVTEKTDYMIYGEGVGGPFITALEHGVTFLSLDYFEDMIKD